MSCVLDASTAIELVLPSGAVDLGGLAARLAGETLWVPEVWHLEVLNVLLKRERQLRRTAVLTASALSFLDVLVDRTDPMPATDAALILLPLARAERLSVFDAAYLDLAEREGLKLATLDSALAAAALRRGTALLPLTP